MVVIKCMIDADTSMKVGKISSFHSNSRFFSRHIHLKILFTKYKSSEYIFEVDKMTFYYWVLFINKEKIFDNYLTL